MNAFLEGARSNLLNREGSIIELYHLFYSNSMLLFKFIVRNTILAIIVGTKGEFPQNFETTSDLEVLYFKQSL